MKTAHTHPHVQAAHSLTKPNHNNTLRSQPVKSLAIGYYVTLQWQIIAIKPWAHNTHMHTRTRPQTRYNIVALSSRPFALCVSDRRLPLNRTHAHRKSRVFMHARRSSIKYYTPAIGSVWKKFVPVFSGVRWRGVVYGHNRSLIDAVSKLPKIIVLQY